MAEFVLCTLATYFLGDAIIQWTLMMSVMLFSMGFGSRISRLCKEDMLDLFTGIEFGLSILCGTAAVVAYAVSPFLGNVGVVIYPLGALIGLCVGMEIPLITRVNAAYEGLRVNVSSVLEKDYYGALVGGLFFAFVALPKLGLTYTPVLLGAINYTIASVFLYRFRSLLRRPRLLTLAWGCTGTILILVSMFSRPIVLFGEQALYKDTVVLVKQTPYQRLVVTRWRDDYWLYINGNEQFSTYDEERYHEPLVHPAMGLTQHRSEVLVLGGGDGMAVREILKHEEVRRITLVDIDPEMTNLSMTDPLFLQLNDHALTSKKVRVVNADAFHYLQRTSDLYDVIIVDLPDPNSLELGRLYSLNFYRLVKRHLKRGGTVVTQATSPVFTREAFVCISKTMADAGFSVVPYHNHVPTLGDWGFVLGVEERLLSPAGLMANLLNVSYDRIETNFLNQDAVRGMVRFGKQTFLGADEVLVNEERKPVLHEYYRQGRWEVY